VKPTRVSTNTPWETEVGYARAVRKWKSEAPPVPEWDEGVDWLAVVDVQPHGFQPGARSRDSRSQLAVFAAAS